MRAAPVGLTRVQAVLAAVSAAGLIATAPVASLAAPAAGGELNPSAQLSIDQALKQSLRTQENEQHIASRIPWAGTREALRRFLSFKHGRPNYDAMAPEAAARARQPGAAEQSIPTFGAPKTITFMQTDSDGFDVYEVDFQKAKVEWLLGPLTPDGKISRMFFHKVS